MRKNTMKMLGVMLLSAYFSGGTVFAETPGIPDPDSQQDVEVLLDTLNEVLEENRKMRRSLSESEESMNRLTRQNSALRAQVESLQQKTSRLEGVETGRVAELEGMLGELKEKKVVLSGENEMLQELRLYYEERIPQLEEEAFHLYSLLDRAFLEGEREEYLRLIESAQEMAARSFEELAGSKTRMLELREEMGAAYYQLGNMLFDMRDFENAVHSYSKALEADPRDPWVHHNLAIIHDYYIHDDRTALFHYEEYLRLKPLEEEAHEIRERVLELELKKNMKPARPVRKDFYESYTKVPR